MPAISNIRYIRALVVYFNYIVNINTKLLTSQFFIINKYFALFSAKQKEYEK